MLRGLKHERRLKWPPLTEGGACKVIQRAEPGGIEMAISRSTPPRAQQLTSKCYKAATCDAVRSVYGRSGQQVSAMWFRSLVLATALVTVSLPTFARSELSDARKWKVLLPFVRASTDCIAQGIVASPVALNYA